MCTNCQQASIIFNNTYYHAQSQGKGDEPSLEIPTKTLNGISYSIIRATQIAGIINYICILTVKYILLSLHRSEPKYSIHTGHEKLYHLDTCINKHNQAIVS